MNPVVSKAHARITEFGVERLKRLQYLVGATLRSERDAIKKEASSGNVTDVEQLESMRDELAMLGVMSGNVDQLAFVGLYSLVELKLKALLERHIEALVAARVITSKKAKQVYKIDVLEQVLKDHLNVHLTRVTNFAAIDETRLINNSVKHNGVVSPELAKKYPGWKQGRPLNGLPRAFGRLSPKVSPFVEDLARKLPNPPARPTRSRALP